MGYRRDMLPTDDVVACVCSAFERSSFFCYLQLCRHLWELFPWNRVPSCCAYSSISDRPSNLTPSVFFTLQAFIHRSAISYFYPQFRTGQTLAALTYSGKGLDGLQAA
jgi:hypothetical protein